MKYLAFDCSSENIYVCAFDGSKRYECNKYNSSGTESLMVAIDECLASASMKISDCECLGVCVGPGSWTGCRVAVVSALGLISGLQREPKVVAVTSFDILGETKKVKLVKAYANFVFANLNGENICIDKDELLQKVKQEQTVSRTEIFNKTEIKEVDLPLAVELKIRNNDFVTVEQLEPMYLRASQAELQLKKKQGDVNAN